MKKLLLIMLSVIVLSVTNACSGGASDPRTDLLGRWELINSETPGSILAANLEFNENGTLIVEESWLQDALDYEYVIVARGRMKITREGVSDALQYKIEDDTLSIIYQGILTEYQRISTPTSHPTSIIEDSTQLTLTPQDIVIDQTATPAHFAVEEATAPASPTFTPSATPTVTLIPPTNACYSTSLQIYGSAFVIRNGNEMRLRNQPGFTSAANLSDQLAIGEVVLLVNGPKCNDGWRFWEILTTRNERGWIPEWDGSDMWLEAIPTYQACPGAVVSRLRVGDIAFVQEIPDIPNRVRVEPIVDSEIVARIYPLSEMEILEGPLCGEGGVWWKVKSMKSGRTGWTMESRNGEYYIAPVFND